MKRINRKGFTMIEILAAVVILGILSILAITAVSKLTEKARKEDKDSYEDTLKMAAESYMQANQSALPKSVGAEVKIESTELVTKKYLKEDKGGCVEVRKKNKNKYEYIVKENCNTTTVCPADSTKKPVITAYFTDASNEPITGQINDFKNVSLHIEVDGGKDGSTQLALEGYSYVIFARTPDDNDIHEVYNSGALSANEQEFVRVHRKLVDFVDVSGKTDFSATVSATNAVKCSSTGGTNVAVEDPDKPTCTPDKEGISNEWINKSSEETSRTITVTCEDGNGSGCIRDKFSRTWPNDQQEAAEYAYIQVKDNYGNVNIEGAPITAANLCDLSSDDFEDIDTTCRVPVRVDRVLPSIKVLGSYKSKNDNGEPTGDNTCTNKLTVDDNTELGTGKITSDQYNNLSRGWMNNDKYPYGVVFEIELSDNIHLDSWKWETNQPLLTRNIPVENTTFKESFEGYRESMSSTNSNSNCGKIKEKIRVGFNKEGRRKGKLTVTDKAGNVTTLYIEANIDKTAPETPKMTYTKYTPTANGNWSNKKYAEVTVYDENNEQDKKTAEGTTLSEDLSGWNRFEYTLKYLYDSSKNKTNENGGKIIFNETLEGKNTISFRSCDAADNCSDPTTTDKVWVDYTYPKCDITRDAPGETSYGWVGNNKKITITATCNESVNGNNENKNSGCTGEKTFNYVYDSESKRTDGGAKGFNTGGYVIDKAGNKTDCDANSRIYIDYTKPKCTISGQPAAGDWTKNGRTIERKCVDTDGTVNSGCTQSFSQKHTYDKSGKTYKLDTTNYVEQTIRDLAGNTFVCNKIDMRVYVDKQAPDCSGSKSHLHTTDGVTIKYSCSDNGGSGVVSCPGGNDHTVTEKKKDQSTTVKDNVGNSMTCKVNVTAYNQYRYIKKNVAATCTKGCCGYIKKTSGTCCGWNKHTGQNCRNCGSVAAKYKDVGSSGKCPSGYSNIGCIEVSHDYCQKYRCKKPGYCKTCTWNTTAKSCANACTGAKTCTSASCCGYICGSQWTSWGASSTGCKSQSRKLYK